MTFNPLLVGAIQLSGASAAVPEGPKGYVAGGSGMKTSADRLEFATDTLTTVVLDTVDWNYAEGISDSTTYSYISGDPYYGGGSTSGAIRQWSLVTEVGSAESAVLSTPRYGGCTFGNTTYGYWSKGYDGSRLTVVQKFTYSTKAISSATSLAVGSNDLVGFTSSTLGFSFGGYTNTGEINNVYGTNLSSGTYSTMTNAPANTSGGTTTSNVGTAAYINCSAAGNTSLYKNTYSSDSYSTLTSMLTSAYPHKGATGSLNNGSTSGFITQNYNVAIAKINFSNDTSANLSATLSGGAGTKGGAAITQGWL